MRQALQRAAGCLSRLRRALTMQERRSAMSIELTGDQLQAAGKEPLRVTDPESHREYVVLPAEDYEALRALAAQDPFNTRGSHSPALSARMKSGRRPCTNGPRATRRCQTPPTGVVKAFMPGAVNERPCRH